MGASKPVHKISKFNSYANLCKFIQNHKKSFFFISQPILIWFALSGRAKLGTLNFYTEFLDFAPLINYGNLCKFIPKKKKLLLLHYENVSFGEHPIVSPPWSGIGTLELLSSFEKTRTLCLLNNNTCLTSISNTFIVLWNFSDLS